MRMVAAGSVAGGALGGVFGGVVGVVKELLVAVFVFGFGAFLVATLVHQIHGRIWRRIRFLAAGGFARARIVESVQANRSRRRPRYRLTVDFTSRHGARLDGVALAQTTSTTGRLGAAGVVFAFR